MQSKKSSSWSRFAVLGLIGCFSASACVISSDDDDDDDIPLAGAAGKPASGGSTSTGGTTAAGSGGTTAAGSGGTTAAGTGGVAGQAGAATTLACDPTTGTKLTSCAPTEGATGDDLKCEQCRETKCCDLWKDCGSSAPDNACGWGGPDNDGEFNCVRRCILRALEADGVADSNDVSICAGECATDVGEGCGDGQITNITQDLYVCMKTDCSAECFNGAILP